MLYYIPALIKRFENKGDKMIIFGNTPTTWINKAKIFIENNKKLSIAIAIGVVAIIIAAI